MRKTRGVIYNIYLFAMTVGVTMVSSPSDGASTSPAPSSLGFQMVTTNNNMTTVYPACNVSAAGGVNSLRTCSVVLPKVVSLLKGFVKTQVDALYAGKPYPNLTASGSGAQAPILQKPICNLVDKVYGSGESSTNHLGESCGSGANPVCQLHCPAPVPNPLGSPVPIVCNWDPVSCQSERAWARGSVVQAIWYFYDQVVQEISDTAGRGASPHLNLSPGGYCSVAATDPTFMQSFVQMNNAFQLYAQLNGNQPIGCPSSGPSAAGAPVQEQCYLSASRDSLEFAISTIGLCEVFARAYGFWQVSTSPIASLDGLPKMASGDAMAVCNKVVPVGPPAKTESCLNKNYPAAIQTRFTNHMQPQPTGIFPSGYFNAPTQ